MSKDPESDELTRSLAWTMDAGDAPRLLVFWEGGFAARPLRAGKSLTVGRSQDCDVHVLHPSVSRRHVTVHVGSTFTVEDLGSANGTFMSGTRLPAQQRVPLEPGKVVEAGAALLVVHAPSSHASDATFASPPALLAAASGSGSGGAMARVRRLVELVAVSGLSVVLLGETGVGKEVLASEIHARSPRAKGPFVRLNCAAIPEPLLESELFGHERGAFTGAVTSKPGLLEAASLGTFLLDEVAELPSSTQAKLLRALESREVRRVGGVEPRPIDVRFIAATHRDLAKLVDTGSFRGDLYYRLNGISIQIPPLRERVGEIEALVRTFIGEACARVGRKALPIASDALRALEAHVFPGNIRELKNVIERTVVLCEGAQITREHLLFDETGPGAKSPAVASRGELGLNRDVAGYERERILDALAQAQGNQTRAAELLGISRRALIGRLETHGLPRPRKDRKA